MPSFPVDCEWGTWGAWDTCSKTCDGGMQTSNRTIAQQAEDGGIPCLGEAMRKQYCNDQPCPGKQCSGSSTDSESCNLKNCPGEETILIVEGGHKDNYFQLMATGGVGVRGVHVQRHVVWAPSLVQGQKLGLFKVDVNLKATQLTQHFAT